MVDIIREFLAVEDVVGRLLEAYGRGELRFGDVEELVSDSEASPLFRLKERCHALFRSDLGHSRMLAHREVLFDLAVGSLFHEAMKFRENFYQSEVYGPRVRALRDEAGEEAEALFAEFEKIQGAVSERLQEGLQETESLLARMREQLGVLLAEHRSNGHATRFLLEHRVQVEKTFSEGLDSLLEQMHGTAANGYTCAAHSYLESGYYDEAEQCFREAIGRGGEAAGLELGLAYARGMAAYLKGDYAEAVLQLGIWADGSGDTAAGLAELAHTAVTTIDDLASGADRDETVRAASALLERLAPLRRDAAGAATGADSPGLL